MAVLDLSTQEGRDAANARDNDYQAAQSAGQDPYAATAKYDNGYQTPGNRTTSPSAGGMSTPTGPPAGFTGQIQNNGGTMGAYDNGVWFPSIESRDQYRKTGIMPNYGGSTPTTGYPVTSPWSSGYAKNPTVDALPIDQQFEYYRNNSTEGQQEIGRAKSVYDQTGSSSAHDWATQLRQAMGISDYDPTYGAYNPSANSINPDGTIHTQVGGKPSSDVTVSNGSAFGSANDVSKLFGATYSKDNNGNYIVSKDGKSVNVLPIGYDPQGNPVLGYRDVAEKLGYQVSYDDKNKTAMFTPPQPTTQLGGQQQNGNFQQTSMQPYPMQSFLPQMSQYMPQQPQITPFQTPDLSAYSSHLMGYNTFNPDMNNYYTQAHNQLDPQYQAKYNNLLAKQGTDLKGMDESMNRRGIYTSGLAEAAANDLRAKTTNTVANVFLQQQGAINKMAQQLYQNAYKQYQDGNQLALKNNQFYMQQMMNEQKQTFTQWLSTQKLNQSQYTSAVNSWDKMATLMLHDAQMQMQDSHFQQNMDWNQFKFDNLSADQQAGLKKSYDQMDQMMNRAMLPYTMGPTPYQGAELDLKRSAQEAANYFKQQGINIDANKLEEIIRHNQSTETESTRHNQQSEQNQQDTLRLRLYDMMGYDQNGTPTLSRQKLDETIAHDAQTVQTAKDNATTSANKSVVDGIGKQLTAINSQISAIYNSGTMSGNDANAKQSAAAELKTLSDKRDTYLNQLSQYTNRGFVGNP